MPNCNCLEGLACPRCGNDSRLRITANALFEVTDAGAESVGDIEWDDRSYAACPECEYHSTLAAFRAAGTLPSTSKAQE
jgi:hypothetical protein